MQNVLTDLNGTRVSRKEESVNRSMLHVSSTACQVPRVKFRNTVITRVQIGTFSVWKVHYKEQVFLSCVIRVCTAEYNLRATEWIRLKDILKRRFNAHFSTQT